MLGHRNTTVIMVVKSNADPGVEYRRLPGLWDLAGNRLFRTYQVQVKVLTTKVGIDTPRNLHLSSSKENKSPLYSMLGNH